MNLSVVSHGAWHGHYSAKRGRDSIKKLASFVKARAYLRGGQEDSRGLLGRICSNCQCWKRTHWPSKVGFFWSAPWWLFFTSMGGEGVKMAWAWCCCEMPFDPTWLPGWGRAGFMLILMLIPVGFALLGGLALSFFDTLAPRLTYVDKREGNVLCRDSHTLTHTQRKLKMGNILR